MNIIEQKQSKKYEKMDISEQTIFSLYRKFIDGSLDANSLFECQKELNNEIISARILNSSVERKEALLDELLWIKSYLVK